MLKHLAKWLRYKSLRRAPLLPALLGGFFTPTHITLIGTTAVGQGAAQKALFLRRDQGPLGAFIADWQLSAAAGFDANYRIDHIVLGLGAAYLTNTTFINGTKWNFELRLGYQITHRFEVMVTHFSNCKQICGFKRNGPNIGWDFVGVGYRFP